MNALNTIIQDKPLRSPINQENIDHKSSNSDDQDNDYEEYKSE